MSRFKNAQEIHAENGTRDMRLENMKIEELFTAHMSEAHPEKQMPEPREEAEKQECFTYDDMRHAFARGWHASKHVRDEGMRAAMQSSASSSCAAHMEWRSLDTAPKDDSAVMLRVRLRYGKRGEFAPMPGFWMNGYWVIFNADEEIQRVEPTHWMPLLRAPLPESEATKNAAGQEESSEVAVVESAQDAARTPAPAAPTPRTLQEALDMGYQIDAENIKIKDAPSDRWKHWREARPMELEPHYCYWVSHLTSEGLHAKSDIATVLAILHQQRDDLEADVKRLHSDKMALIDEKLSASSAIETISDGSIRALAAVLHLTCIAKSGGMNFEEAVPKIREWLRLYAAPSSTTERKD